MLGLSPLAIDLLDGGPARGLLEPLRYLPPGRTPDGTPPPVDRSRLAAALRQDNLGWGHPAAETLAARLTDPATAVVVSGQQPGLLGGPLYTLTKMVAVSRWAAHLEAQGQPAVGLFWVATEDHDVREVSRATVLTRDGSETLSLFGDHQPDGLVPVGMRTFGPGLDEVFSRLGELMPTPRAEAWWQRVRQWYRPGARFGEAFARLMIDLLGHRAPLLLDSMNPTLRALQAPLARRLVDDRRGLATALEESAAAVTGAGFPLQVRLSADAGPLFLLRHGGRRRIEWSGEDRFTLRGTDGSWPVTEVEATLEGNPSAVSPWVLVRPLLQDAVLGTHLHLVGPGEAAYLAQSAPLYDRFGVRPPFVALRPRAVVLEERLAGLLPGRDLAIEDALSGREALRRELARAAGADFLPALRSAFHQTLETLGSRALGLDQNLERPFEKTREQVVRALDRFGDKVRASALSRGEIETRRWQNLWSTALPDEAPQERVVCSAFFPARFGPGFGELFFRRLDPLAPGLQLIVGDEEMSPGSGPS